MRRATILAFVFWQVSSAHACPIEDLTQQLARADDHLSWFDFWQDLDAREASTELGFARWDYAAITARLQEDDCKGILEAQKLSRTTRRSLATCERWSTLQAPAAMSMRAAK